MRLFTRLITCAAAALLLFAVLSHVADSWFGENTSVVGAGRQLMLEARRTEALQTREEMVVRSLSAKREIINQLLAGRLHLHQAILQFQRANELVENIDMDLIAAYRTPSDPPGLGGQVLVWARNSIASPPSDKIERRLADLECEYQTLFDGAKSEEEADARPMEPQSTGRTETASPAW